MQSGLPRQREQKGIGRASRSPKHGNGSAVDMSLLTMSIMDMVTRLNTDLARENAEPTLGTVRNRTRLARALFQNNDVCQKAQS